MTDPRHVVAYLQHARDWDAALWENYLRFGGGFYVAANAEITLIDCVFAESDPDYAIEAC